MKKIKYRSPCFFSIFQFQIWNITSNVSPAHRATHRT